MDVSDRIPRCWSLSSFKSPQAQTLTGRLRAFVMSGGGSVQRKRPVTATQAVEILDALDLPTVPKNTIRKWAEREKVRKYGLNEFGHQKYELADIIAHAMREQAKPIPA